MMEYITRPATSAPTLESTEIAPNILTSITFDNDTEPDDVDPQKEIVRMIQVIARPPIIVLGTTGNVLTFITMQRGSLKHISTCFYMAILGLADTGGCRLYRLKIS